MFEQEAKFYVQHLDHLEARLNRVGARLAEPRQHEVNQRFDSADGGLLAASVLLRLRTFGPKNTLTFKGPLQVENGLNVRREIEFSLNDPAAAHQLFTALGYHVCFIYEKFRTVYLVGGAQVMLDELPIGGFVEIEGSHSENIRAVAALLELHWERQVPANYNDLFNRARLALNLPFSDMTFDNFNGVAVSPADLGLLPADGA